MSGCAAPIYSGTAAIFSYIAAIYLEIAPISLRNCRHARQNRCYFQPEMAAMLLFPVTMLLLFRATPLLFRVTALRQRWCWWPPIPHIPISIPLLPMPIPYINTLFFLCPYIPYRSKPYRLAGAGSGPSSYAHTVSQYRLSLWRYALAVGLRLWPRSALAGAGSQPCPSRAHLHPQRTRPLRLQGLFPPLFPLFPYSLYQPRPQFHLIPPRAGPCPVRCSLCEIRGPCPARCFFVCMCVLWLRGCFECISVLLGPLCTRAERNCL